MNREDFLMRLSSLLQDVSEAEREEALQYYEDYFDDAGRDKEEEIIDSLGSPAEVAKSIKKELFGIETEEEISPEDRKLTKYNSRAKQEEEQKKAGQNTSSFTEKEQNPFFQTTPSEDPFFNGTGSFHGTNGAPDLGGKEGADGNGAGRDCKQSYQQENEASCEEQDSQSGQTWNGEGYGEKSTWKYHTKKTEKKATLPTWVWVLIVISLILLSPGIIGGVGTVIAVICALAVAWLGLILGFGMAAVVLLVVMVGLFIVGFAGVTVSPMGTVGLIGGGLLCGGIGILFLMLTVAMAGAATPALWRGLVKLCKWIGSLFTRKKA